MKKTGSEVEKDIYNLVKNSLLASSVSGGTYRYQTRPRDSKNEDIIIIFITALEGDTQDGAVSINVYIPYMSFGKQLMKNVKRCSEIEILCQSFIESLPVNDYLFRLGQTIATFDEPEINQHFINIKLRFKHNTLN